MRNSTPRVHRCVLAALAVGVLHAAFLGAIGMLAEQIVPSNLRLGDAPLICLCTTAMFLLVIVPYSLGRCFRRYVSLITAVHAASFVLTMLIAGIVMKPATSAVQERLFAFGGCFGGLLAVTLPFALLGALFGWVGEASRRPLGGESSAPPLDGIQVGRRHPVGSRFSPEIGSRESV
jgi:hypothetical protein